MRVLLIEDQPAIAAAVRTMLERRKFAVESALDGEIGLDYLLRGSADIAVVDIVLPKRDGFEIVAEARAQGIQLPVIMLTSRDAVEDRVRGLDCGADDYLVKPFVEEELIARINALLRRADKPIQQFLQSGKLTIDTTARTATYDSRLLEVGSTEFRVLEFLARNAGITFTRTQLLERLWEYDFEGSTNIVDVYVSQLRRKLKDAGARDFIKTVWGVGYRVDA
ncbi:MAG: response regulator transcription factor [Candidatus Eremiobacteraeota bacterium]|nr:response regulator transcription factor [Candidatus Eremiobacteraeota bacterium]